MFKVEPIENLELKVLQQLNVYRAGDTVYKLFDMQDAMWAKPNVQVVHNIPGNDYLREMKEIDLTVDGRCKLLTYKYIVAKQDTITLEDFKPIAAELDALHEADYVHSDDILKCW